jgi:hypothetical protein
MFGLVGISLNYGSTTLNSGLVRGSAAAQRGKALPALPYRLDFQDL